MLEMLSAKNAKQTLQKISKIISMIQKYKTNLNELHTTYGDDWIKHIISISNNYNKNEIIMEILDDLLNEVVVTLVSVP